MNELTEHQRRFLDTGNFYSPDDEKSRRFHERYEKAGNPYHPGARADAWRDLMAGEWSSREEFLATQEKKCAEIVWNTAAKEGTLVNLEGKWVSFAQHADAFAEPTDVPDEPSQETGSPEQELGDALLQTADKAGKVAGEIVVEGTQAISVAGQAAGQVVLEGAEKGMQSVRDVGRTVQDTMDKVQRKISRGEDYDAVLRENPIVRDTMSRAHLIVENEELLRTVFNVPWVTTLLWSAAAGSVVTLQGPIAHVAGGLAHYGPGHVHAWGAVNTFMDTAVGAGHRLKFGHSIEYLPQIVEEFGSEGVPAYFLHLAQDFTTIDGIPIVPHAWDAKKWLELKGLNHTAATGLVATSFSSIVSALGVFILGAEL